MSSSFHVREKARRVELYRQQMTIVRPLSVGFVERVGTSPITGGLEPDCQGIVFEPFEQRFTAPSRRGKMALESLNGGVDWQQV